jgi:peptidoglycan/LPS O-acetylase OafA/YrhL
MSAPLPGDRLHALDAVRGFALLLGVVLHATMSFIPSVFPVWITQDQSAEAGYGLLFYVPHIFRMTLFFFIAGFFARLAYQRRGAISFAFDRFKRIALPFAAFWTPIFAGIVTAMVWGAVKANGGEMPEGESPPLTFANLPLTHMWFLYLLLVFYAAAMLIRLPIALIDRNGAVRGLVDKLVGWIGATPLGLVVLAAPVAIAFHQSEAWYGWFGIPTPDVGWVPNTIALTGYGVAFGFGWLVHRRLDLLQSWKRWWPVNAVLAIGLTAYCLNAIGQTPAFALMEGQQKALYAGAYALAGWAWSLALIGAAMQFWSGKSAWRRYLADASYWIYLLHLPIVMLLQVWLNDAALPAALKLTLIVGGTTGVLLLSYHFLVRRSWLGAWLNGKRIPRANPAAKPDATAEAPLPQS